jgi:prophage regulatory protein
MSEQIRILPLREVETMVGLQKTAIYNAIKRDGFPAPIKLTARKSGWLLSEVTAWVEKLAAARARAPGVKEAARG